MQTTTPLVDRARQYLPDSFRIKTWGSLKPYFRELVGRKIDSGEDLAAWLLDRSELHSVINETLAIRHIAKTCDNRNEDKADQYFYLVEGILPHIAPFEDELNKKMIASEFLPYMEKKHPVFVKLTKNRLNLFNEKNIELLTAHKVKSAEFGVISGKMSIRIDGKEKTMQQAQALLESNDRALREEAFKLIGNRRLKDKDEFNSLLEDLLNIRQRIAKNAGFKNYRDFRFKDLGRFDYSVRDTQKFFDSISEKVVPLYAELLEKRKKALKLKSLRPWDLHVDIKGDEPLKPFKNVRELLSKSIDVLTDTHHFFGVAMTLLKEKDHFDLGTRKGKDPGGYNMTFKETGVPFVFMNAAGTMADVRTLMHEAGHAVQSIVMHELPIAFDRDIPAEIAELAAMTMELLTMDNWGRFFNDEQELKRAKHWQLTRVVSILPWIATVARFQHWMHTHPDHSLEQREAAWGEISQEFEPDSIDWTGLEEYRGSSWQRQLHIFNYPHYYIEYAFAQLGAIAIWKRSKDDFNGAVEDYLKALRLGYSKPIKKVYRAAGIKFDFSPEYIAELMDFVKSEIDSL